MSLRSSYDYIDIDMAAAMRTGGENALAGRGSRFFKKKTFKEDNWSGDESVFNRQMKMPNVNTTKQEYQREIGINLEAHQHHNALVTITKQSEDKDEPYKEALEMLPESPFYKIVKKDRIAAINDYYDRWPLLPFRKMIMRWRVYINRGA